MNYGTQPLHAEPLTAHRQETIKQLDFRAEKRFTLAGRVKLGMMFDVYNVFNANPELNIRSTTGRLAISEIGQRTSRPSTRRSRSCRPASRASRRASTSRASRAVRRGGLAAPLFLSPAG